MTSNVSVRRGGAHDVALALQILNQSYGTTSFTPDWHAWKHLECPFGPSRLILAEVDSAVCGAFFALPWDYRLAGRTFAGARTVDGGTLPAARGRRVLGAMIADEVGRWSSDGSPGVVVATATDAARRSHVRNGALALPPLRYGICAPPLTRPARVDRDLDTLDSYVFQEDGMGTAWTGASLRWRIDQRGGNAYEVVTLCRADGPNGLAYRTTTRGRVSIVIPVIMWGSQRERRQLLAAAAWSSRAPGIMVPIGEGAETTGLRPVRGTSHAWVCVWDRRSPPTEHANSPLGRLSGWSLSYGELEGII